MSVPVAALRARLARDAAPPAQPCAPDVELARISGAHFARVAQLERERLRTVAPQLKALRLHDAWFEVARCVWYARGQGEYLR